MKRLFATLYAFLPFALVALALAAPVEKPLLDFSVPDKKHLVSMDKDGNVTWYAPKDEVAKSLLVTLGQRDQQVQQLTATNQQLLEAVNSNKTCLDVVRKYLIAKNPQPAKEPLTKDEKEFIKKGAKQVKEMKAATDQAVK